MTSFHSEYLLLILTQCFLLSKYDCIQLITVLHIPYFFSLNNKRLCGTLAKAFLKSVYIISTPLRLLSKFFVHLSNKLSSWIEVDQPFINPYC